MKLNKLATLSQRTLIIFIGLQALVIFAGGYILEYYFYYMPCVLCFIQRYLFLLCSVSALVGGMFFSSTILRYLSYTVAILSSVLGLAVGLHHRNVQSLPIDKIQNCSQSISQMLENFEFGKIIESWLHGDSECHIIQKFLGINLTEWSIILFSILLMQLLYTIKKVE
ncbi:MAG: disulfide bond formation protein B [Francisellaceae bacterium]|jgi:protein dithiol:quinone oxidoreductase|nr:disulfide bond formation protein B [Francisellaceae bacterium]MBT6208186.1 disulfide bond formation protein B [Francisellaceae bacterium]MBT6538892.1 disulfide bond formation protein B [Francisellaceae bacterium]